MAKNIGVQNKAKKITNKYKKIIVNPPGLETKKPLLPKSENSFQGRRQELIYLKTFFDENQKSKKRIVAIHGPSGYGASELSIQFLKEYIIKDEKITNFVWVNAETEESVKKSFKKHLQCFDEEFDAEVPETAKQMNEYFQTKSCVVVFDHVTNKKTIADFEPTENCFILITTNISEWHEDVTTLNLTPLNQADAVGVLRFILREHFKPEDQKLYEELADLVGCVPRELHKAASYIIYEIGKQYEEFNLQKCIRTYQSAGNSGAGQGKKELSEISSLWSENKTSSLENNSQSDENNRKSKETNTTALNEEHISGQPSTSQSDKKRTQRQPNNSGTTFQADKNNEQKNGYRKLVDEKNDQFIRGEWQNNRLVKLHNAQFQMSKTDYIRLYGSDNLYTSNKNNFVARYELPPELNIRNGTFYNIREEIKSRIKIIKILDDDLKNNLETSRKDLETTLNSYQNFVFGDREVQCDMFHLCRIRGISDLGNIAVLNEISRTNAISQRLKNKAKITCQDEKNYTERNKRLFLTSHIKDQEFLWINVILKCINASSTNLKHVLLKALPTQNCIPSGQEDINTLKDHQVFTCNEHDIKLFSDLELTIQQHSKTFELDINNNFHHFTEEYINKLWKILINKINYSKLKEFPQKPIYTNPVFLQLFKTFIELLNLSCIDLKKDINKIVQIKSEVNLSIIKGGVYENLMKLIISLMNHFKPGDVNNNIFKYKFSFFSMNETILNRFTNYIYSYIDDSLENIPQESVIWLYYIHTSFSDMLSQAEPQQSDANKQKLFAFLNTLMNFFKIVIMNQEVSLSLEKVRILASSISKFGTTISPYFYDQNSVNEDEMSLLLKQAEYIKDFLKANKDALDDITSIVDIYQVFWDERKHLIKDLSSKFVYGISSTDSLISNFNSFVSYIFNLKIYSIKYLIFLRSFNEFIRLLRNTNFPWYIKKEDLLSNKFVKSVDINKDSYLVTETESFLQEFSSNNSRRPPRHYILDVAIHFMECARQFLDQNTWNDNDKIQAASDLLLLMARSLINFKRCANALEFQKFFDEFTEPFDRVTLNSSNINDFKRRLGSLEHYYEYTIQLNTMSVTNALQLCSDRNHSSNSKINYSFNSSILESCFNVYLNKFNTYIFEYIQTGFNELVNSVRAEMKTMEIGRWDASYKKIRIPELLAGLSAVWSALESRDVNCTKQEQVIKPHCIQILCILRLLGVDQNSSGFDSHLAQVLTGQGKSIVLGLLAAVLAFTGNPVRIVCYSKYLAKRDENDFQPFYVALNIQNRIKYGTFEDMANEILSPKIRETNYDLRKFVQKLITGELPRLDVTEEKNEVSKTVLLIDEVDVFFSPEFYGNTYNPCTLITSEALGDLQKMIWDLTSDSGNNVDRKKNVQKYISAVLSETSDTRFINIATHSNTILNSHVDEMISTAVSVRNSCEGDWYSQTFKLRKDGRIITIEKNGEHSTTSFYRYDNVFMYFKLKKTQYNHKDFKNYGYLNVLCGNVSYAILPKDYQAILGVTGTLKQLSAAELDAVLSYKITRGSDMPTFFGGNKLRQSTFTVKETVDDWTKAILDSILSVVKIERAVIVFFEDEHTIDKVRSQFVKHLSRYSVLTGNESNEELSNCVEEAGVARKVTIATRRMGRGVDFKSNDSAVEAKGGVHVIQTFWSEDVKEETQIKGRTARKDNSGSYEAILCRQHLPEVYKDTECNYTELSVVRARCAEEKAIVLAKNIKESQEKHIATMKFLKSFYNYSLFRRNEYFDKYPFVEL